MATKEALEGLEKTGKALIEISKQLKPFIAKLETAEGKALAQAQAVVALSMGTLRYMGARLRGLDQGRKPDDPLRQELNEMRRVLTEVEKMNNDESTKQHKSSEGNNEKRINKFPSNGNVKNEAKSEGETAHNKSDTTKRKSPERTTATSSRKKQRRR